MVAVLGIDKLRVDPDPVAGLANAAFDHVARAQLFADLAHVGRSALVGECGVACDHGERPPQ